MATLLERRYRRRHLECVRHITLDPKGRGVLRIHMIPPRQDADNAPFLLLLNGSRLVPLNLSWAILLANFMDRLEPFTGVEIAESDWNAMAAGAVAETHKTYPFTSKEQLAGDLATMIRSLVAIARGQEPEAEVAPLTLGEYAPEMTAPHRMDLMVSAMTRGGAWHCNQKCLHCYAAGQPLSDTPELTTAQWKEILAKLRAANVPQVTFTGGEPTLRADLVELVEAGNITNQKKTLHRGKSVATFLMGTRRLYDYVDNNPAVAMYPVQYVNDPYVIAQNDNLVSINSCVQIDIMGQVVSTSAGLRQISGVGGQIDFVRGANMSKGGRAIMAMPSTTGGGKISKIVPFLDQGSAVTTSRNDVNYVVTEYGIAQLRGKNLRQRAEELIAIAHPDFRDELKEAYERRFQEAY